MATPPTAAAPTTDGRARRTERSREAIVTALVELVGEGRLEPTAQDVADRAGVGIRTVFRLFSDVETLFTSVAARVQAEALPLLLDETPKGTAEERARTVVKRRCNFYAQIAPYKRSAHLRRWRSDFVRAHIEKNARALRSDLLGWLPELNDAPADLVEAMDLAVSFEAWDRLRTDQGLSLKAAAATMERTALALLASR